EQRPAQRLRSRKSQVFDAGEMRREASVPRVELGSLDQAARPVPEKRREAHRRERRLHESQPSARGGRALLRIAPELAGVQHLSSSKRRELQEPAEGRQVRYLRKVPHVTLEVRLHEPAEPQRAIADLSQRDRRETSYQHVLRTKWRRSSAREPRLREKGGEECRVIGTPAKLPKRKGPKREVDGPA